MKTFLITALLLFVSLESEAAQILGVFPHIGKSHNLFFEPIMLALASRGHEVVYVSQYPIKNPPPSLKNIDLTGTHPAEYVNAIPVDVVSFEFLNVLAIRPLADLGVSDCESVLSSKPIQDLIKSNLKFDLVFYESFNADCFLGFIHRFKALSIALSSSAFMPWSGERFGLPDNPSYIVNHFVGLSDKMNFKERLWNAINYVVSKVLHCVVHDGPNYAIAKKYFGEDLPPLSEIAKNTSMYFVNTHFSVYQVRPLPPNIIEAGGLHIQPPGKLNKEFQEYLDNAKEGVVYFSLGSTARGATLPPAKRDAFIEAFKDLPMKILWKWEDDTLPNKPDNVKISKWVPQSAVLAHPNIKLFITHGGLMGTLEAIHYGVPMISIPLFGDQPMNVALCVKKGITFKLSLSDITTENVKNALNSILKNKSYQEQSRKVSQLFHDRPQKPLDAVVFWTEYVLKHRGARHLQSAAVHLSLTQYFLLDVLLALSVIPIFIILLSVLLFRKCSKRSSRDVKKHRKEKRS